MNFVVFLECWTLDLSPDNMDKKKGKGGSHSEPAEDVAFC